MEIDGDEAPLAVVTQQVPAAQFAALEYPGYVRNVPRALQTLGGEQAVQAALMAGSGAYLKLNFRPQEPTSHPIFGDKHETSQLLVRISRKKVRRGASEQPPKVEIVGRVTTSIRFGGLADFAYLPVDNGNNSRDYSRTPEINHPDKAEPSALHEPLLIIPPLFSKVDVPMEYGFKQYPVHAQGQYHARNGLACEPMQASSVMTAPHCSLHRLPPPCMHACMLEACR